MRGAALLLLVYVTLDFANPLMPGAVRFEDGSVHVVHADRTRPLMPSVPVALVPTSEALVDRPADIQDSSRLRLLGEPRRRAIHRVRSAPSPSSDPAVPSEDH
jgi:hypothetical protein